TSAARWSNAIAAPASRPLIVGSARRAATSAPKSATVVSTIGDPRTTPMASGDSRALDPTFPQAAEPCGFSPQRILGDVAGKTTGTRAILEGLVLITRLPARLRHGSRV